MEMSQQAHVRQLQETLTVVGAGVIAFASWSLVKTILMFLLLDEGGQREMLGISDALSMRAFYIAFAVVALFDLAVRLFVSRSARAEGRGKRKGVAYLVVGALLAVLSVVNIVLIALGTAQSSGLFDMVIGIIIEITSAATLVLMIVCAIRLRQLNGFSE